MEENIKELNTLIQDVSHLQEEVDKIHDLSGDIFIYLGFIIAFILAFIFAIFKMSKEKISQAAEKTSKNVSDNISSLFEDKLNLKFAELDVKSSELFKRIEEKHFQYMQVTSLLVSKNYDEALEHAGWRGDFKPYLDEPIAFQRILVTCLSKSNRWQKDAAHLVSWTWSRLLLEKKPSYQSMELVLRTGITLKHFEEAVAEFDKHGNKLSSVEIDQCEPLLFVALRRARTKANFGEYTHRLKEIATKHMDTDDIRVTTNFAAFFRDSGRLEDAHHLMMHNVDRLTGINPTEDGWERLFNTYIANCIDRGIPEAAKTQALTLISNTNRSENVFTVARLAWIIFGQGGDYERLVKSIYSRMELGFMAPNDDGTIKTNALLLDIEGRKDKAIELVEHAIEDAKKRNDKWSKNNYYYYISLLVQLYISGGEGNGIAKAMSVLSPELLKDEVGELQYLMAKACAVDNNPDAVERHLSAAAEIKSKWLYIANNDTVLGKNPIVNALLMKKTQMFK